MAFKVNQQEFERCYKETHPWIENKSGRALAEWAYLLDQFNLIGKSKKKWPQSFHNQARAIMNDWKYEFEKKKEEEETTGCKSSKRIDSYQPISPIPDNHIPFKYKYLSSSISLRTTDEAISKQLLVNHTNNPFSEEKQAVKIKSFHQQNDKILVNIKCIISI